jgi:hypothetical protein
MISRKIEVSLSSLSPTVVMPEKGNRGPCLGIGAVRYEFSGSYQNSVTRPSNQHPELELWKW